MIVDLPYLPYPLRLRPDTSDLDACRHVFDGAAFAGLRDTLGGVTGLVLDLGANVGCSSAWFLATWPGCHVVAVEPDRESWRVLTENLAPYGDRATVIYGAAWSKLAPLRMVETPFRDGRAWSRQVRECAKGEPSDCPGMLVRDLALGNPRIALLKCDIEGAEVELFRDAYWLGMVDAIAIELHDDAGPATETFTAAIDGQGFTVTRAGELTICRR